MTVLFQNSTTVKSESNKTDYDIIHANNDINSRYSARYLAIKYLEHDSDVEKMLEGYKYLNKCIEERRMAAMVLK